MTGDSLIVQHAILRDGARWEKETHTGLQSTEEGALHLARIPAPAKGGEIELPGPFAIDPSGIAAGRCGDLFIADTAGHRIVWRDGICGSQRVLPAYPGASNAPGHFDQPRALLIGPGGLAVADSGNSRVQFFRMPTLELRAIWTGGLQAPAGLATDKLGRVYVLDRALKAVLRLTASGSIESGFNTVLAAALGAAAPKFLSVDDESRLYVSDEVSSKIRCFDEVGAFFDELPLPADAPNFHGGALLARDQQLFVADADAGRIWVYDLARRQCLGALPGWRGPVSAFAIDGQGILYVKPGADAAFYVFPPAAGCLPSGELVTERLDAGERSGWFRAHLDVDRPPGAEIELQFCVSDDATLLAPATTDWQLAPALDFLLPRIVIPYLSEPQGYRYLWLRVHLKSLDGRTSPRLLQAQAETPGEDYMEHLPAVYRRKDNGSLRRWLNLFRAELGGLELLLEELPRRFNAATAPPDDLPWLASWLAFQLPPGSLGQSRDRLARALELHRRRGTPWGVQEYVELYTGVRPVIIESYRGRRIWQLGHSSILGCDTALAPLSPQGMVLPDSVGICNHECDAEQPSGCTTKRIVIGSAVVGVTGPLAADDLGAPLFSETAHRFSVFVFSGHLQEPGRREALRRALDAERPAHTQYDLCLVEPRMRVGLQSSIGIDSYVAGAPDPMSLTGAVLGLNSYLGEEPGEGGASRVGQRALLGIETVLE